MLLALMTTVWLDVQPIQIIDLPQSSPPQDTLENPYCYLRDGCVLKLQCKSVSNKEEAP